MMKVVKKKIRKHAVVSACVWVYGDRFIIAFTVDNGIISHEMLVRSCPQVPYIPVTV